MNQGLADAAGADGELGELTPSLAIEEDKILSIQASKSGTDVSMRDAGSGGSCGRSGGASTGDRAGVLLQPLIQSSDAARSSLAGLRKGILGLHEGLSEIAHTGRCAVLLGADGPRAGQLHLQQLRAGQIGI